MGTRRVPWRDWDEWEEVRSGLSGLDPMARVAALRAVVRWRRRGRVPHAVDVTAQLMEARMHDRGVPGSPGTPDMTTHTRSPPSHLVPFSPPHASHSQQSASPSTRYVQLCNFHFVRGAQYSPDPEKARSQTHGRPAVVRLALNTTHVPLTHPDTRISSCSPRTGPHLSDTMLRLTYAMVRPARHSCRPKRPSRHFLFSQP